MKEKGYIPTNAKVMSGTVSIQAGRYYVSVLIDEEFEHNVELLPDGLGIDLGIKDLAIVSNGDVYKNIKRPGWQGFWQWSDGMIWITDKNGETIDIRKTQDVSYTIRQMLENDWIIA